ncbi:MAG: hypothetical protein ACKUBY_03200 [Candidatus Moraniibacteriota bacterium]|jgi:hypothetical protein
MIEVFRAKIIEDEKEREAALEVIAERENYYVELFANDARKPRITVKYEGASPLTVRILFSPPSGKTVVVNESGYGTADSVTKHAFKKLRRLAKNHFVKMKKRHGR